MTRAVYPALTGALKVVRRAFPAARRARVRQWMFEWLDLTWSTRSRVRLRVGRFTEAIIYNQIFLNGDYDRALALALDFLPDDGSPFQIVDLGANVGFFTLRAVDRLLDRGRRLDEFAITAFEGSDVFSREYQSRVLKDNNLAPYVRL